MAFCAGNSPVTNEFPAQRPVTRSFGVFFGLYFNKRLSKQLWCWWFESLTLDEGFSSRSRTTVSHGLAPTPSWSHSVATVHTGIVDLDYQGRSMCCLDVLECKDLLTNIIVSKSIVLGCQQSTWTPNGWIKSLALSKFVSQESVIQQLKLLY